MGSGFVAGAIAYCAVLPLDLALVPWLSISVLLIAPTALQPWIQVKGYKIVARTLLGVGTAAWLLGCFTAHRTALPRPIECGLCIAVFVLLARLLWWVREKRTASPCTTCPHGAYPTCSWNLPKLLAQVDDQELAEALTSATRSGSDCHLDLRAAGQPHRRSRGDETALKA